MSGLLMKHVWLSGVAMVGLMTAVACGDDDATSSDTTAGNSGKGGGGSGGMSAGTSSGGKAGQTTGGGVTGGKSGSNAGGQSMGGETGMAGEGGAATGGENASGAGGEGGAAASLADIVRALMAGTSPLPSVAVDPTNAKADNADAATLGQKFFFDEKFSGALAVDSDLGKSGDVGKVSCQSCHSGAALDDERSMPDKVSIGTGVHTRNAPGVVNSALYDWTNWGGRFAAQWELPTAVVENGVIMNSTRLAVAHRIYDAYKTDYEAVWGALPDLSDTNKFPLSGKPTQASYDNMAADDKTAVTRILVNYGKSLQAYMRKLVSPAPWDDFMAGNDNAISTSAQRGAQVFMDKGCGECHSGARFSDQGFHALGVPPAGDDGRFADAPKLVAAAINVASIWSDNQMAGTTKLNSIPAVIEHASFRTPSLRNSAVSGPYMHAGQFASLSDVIDFYKAGGNGFTAFDISDGDRADLIAFLGALSSKPLDAGLVADTSAP